MMRLDIRVALLALSLSACASPFRDTTDERSGKTLTPHFQQQKAATFLSAPQGMRLLQDVAYGADPKQRMDVYLPADVDNAPVIFMVHGGGWRIGDKAIPNVFQNKVQRWVTRGFAFISVNHRLLPQSDPQQQARDIAQALSSAQTQARTWGIDPDRFILMGHSAGAHLVGLLAANPDMPITLGARRWLGTISLDTAAMDIVTTMKRWHPRILDQAFGSDAAYWKSVSPMHQLTAAATPMLLVCSSRRWDKPCTQARQFADSARKLGVRVEVLPQAMAHGEINSELGLPGAYTEAVESFMASLDLHVRKRLSSIGVQE